jgi:hypothetical protein
MLLALRVPEDLQTKVMDYHNTNITSKFIIGKNKMKILAPSLLQKIADHQLQAVLNTIPVLKSKNNWVSNLFSRKTVMTLIMPGEVIIKQGDEAEFFNIVLDGFIQVIREHNDMGLEQIRELVNKEMAEKKAEEMKLLKS